MISDSELLAGLAFLEAHAPPEHRMLLAGCRAQCEETVRQSHKNRLRAFGLESITLSVRAENFLDAMGCKTLGGVEVLLGDPNILARGKPHHLTAKCLREIREALKEVGL